MACGSLDADADKPGRLATVVGSITNPDSIAFGADALRVAVVWERAGQALGDGTYGNDRRTARDVAVTPIFPAQFRLDLTELPDAVQPIEELFGAAWGELHGAGGFAIAYDDRNDNGELDLVTPSSPDYVDAVLGQASAPLLYLEGTFPSDLKLLDSARDTRGNLPTLGFNLLQSSCASGEEASCDAAVEWAPIDTPISIELRRAPELATLMCEEIQSGGRSEVVVEHAAGELPPSFPGANDPRVACSPGGRAYTFTLDESVTPPGPCQATTARHEVDTYSLVAGVAAPSGWPCVVD